MLWIDDLASRIGKVAHGIVQSINQVSRFIDIHIPAGDIRRVDDRDAFRCCTAFNPKCNIVARVLYVGFTCQIGDLDLLLMNFPIASGIRRVRSLRHSNNKGRETAGGKAHGIRTLSSAGRGDLRCSRFLDVVENQSFILSNCSKRRMTDHH